MSGFFHPILTHPGYTTILLSWYDGKFHFFERVPANQDGYILLETYYLAYLFSFVVATLLSWRWYKQKSLQVQAHQVFDLLLVTFFGILIGAKIGYVFFYNFEYYLENPSQILLNWSGMASHGAILGSVLGIWIYCQRVGLSTLMVLDHAGILASIGAFFIRFANFLNAELYGRSTTSPLGMHFPIRDGVGRSLFIDSNDQLYAMSSDFVLTRFQQEIPHAYEDYTAVASHLPNQVFEVPYQDTPLSVARLITDPSHPSQLYQMLMAGVCLTGFLLWLKRRKPVTGMLTAAFLLGYGSQRILTEFFRQQDFQRSSGIFQWISLGQLLSLGLIAVGAYLVFLIKKRGAQTEV